MYVSHPSSINFEKEIYVPVRTALGETAQLIFPHENGKKGEFSMNIIKNVDRILAFVDGNSEGRAMEIGWAVAFHVPLTFITKDKNNVYKLYHFIAQQVNNVEWLEYSSEEDLIRQLK